MERKYEYLMIFCIYLLASIFMFSGVITSKGQTAQADWGIQQTLNSSLNNFYSYFYIWKYNAFGNTGIPFGPPFFLMIFVLLAFLGVVGGLFIKVFVVLALPFCGISAYILARSFKLQKYSAFLSGLFYMTTPVLFDWIMFGWVYYIIAYALLPLYILFAERALSSENNLQTIYFSLIGGIILTLTLSQPAFIYVYFIIGVLFFIFENKLIKGFIYLFISSLIGILTSGIFYILTPSVSQTSFYLSRQVYVMIAQFGKISILLNAIRLWGSSFNYQFETYFPQIFLLFSFLPIALAMLLLLNKPKKRVILFATIYLLSILIIFITYPNIAYVVKIPFGIIMMNLSTFIIGSALAIALLLGYLSNYLLEKYEYKKLIIKILLLILVILYGATWWAGQTSGVVISGPPTKLNLAEIPRGYFNWTNAVNANDNYFVLYWPIGGNIEIENNSTFNATYEGISNPIYNINSIPFVNEIEGPFNYSLQSLFNNNSQIAKQWGLMSIKYIVVLTNTSTDYTWNSLSDKLQNQTGINEVAKLPGVIVFEDEYAMPIIYSNTTNLNITYHDPTNYKVSANSTTPFYIIFNQIYDSDWTLFVNGKELPNTAHIKINDFFNGWYVNSTGPSTLDLYYKEQSTYIITLVISMSVFFGVLFYIFIYFIFYRNR